MNQHTNPTEFQAKGWRELAIHNPCLILVVRAEEVHYGQGDDLPEAR
jgi:hypothetical protein